MTFGCSIDHDSGTYGVRAVMMRGYSKLYFED